MVDKSPSLGGHLAHMVPAFVVGLGIGIAGTTGIAIGADLMVPGDVHEAQVREARIQQLARACEAIVERDWREANKPLDELHGWGYDRIRGQVADKTLSWLSADDMLADAAKRVCVQRLRV